MSLASFPRAEVVYDVDTTCDPAKMVLTFHGPPSSPLGHDIDRIAPQRSRRRRLMRPLGIVPANKAEDDEEANGDFQVSRKKETKQDKEKNLKKFREEFARRGLIKSIYGMVEQKVQSACMGTDDILDQRRSRLRELLLAEDVAYTREYVIACQQASANKEAELRKRAFEVKTKAERERLQFVQLKLLEQKVMSCDAARPTLTQKQLNEVKQDQLWQMKEKAALEEARREEDRMYHDLMMKDILALKENEEEIAKLTWKKQNEVRQAFNEQMKWKAAKEEQERRLKEFERVQLEEDLRQFKEEQAKEKMGTTLKKEKIKEEFRESLRQERENKERRRREEEEIERTFNELLNLELERERQQGASNKERLKREMDIFLEKNREMKQQQEEEQRKFEQMIQEFTEKRQKQKDAERRRLKEAREQLFQNVLKEREQQIKEKQEHARREAEREKADLALLALQMEQQQKIQEEYERKCTEQRREYTCTLLRQIEEVKAERLRKKQMEDEVVRLEKLKQEKEIEEVKAILSALPIFPKVHPMKILMKENPPKYPCRGPYT